MASFHALSSRRIGANSHRNLRIYLQLSALLIYFLTNGISGLGSNSVPIIYPDTEDYVAEPGENITLTCEGDAELDWYFLGELLPEINVTDLQEIHEGHTYGKILHIYNISYMDVGFYMCYYTNIVDYDEQNFTNLLEMGHAQQKYIFVRDPDRLGLPNLSSVLTMELYQTVTIPCRPTAPDVIVELEVDSELIYTSNSSKEQVSDVSYDPHIGFTNGIAESFTQQFYICKFIRDTEKDESIFVTRIVHNDNSEANAPKPSITDPYNGKVTVGSNITLNCTVIRKSGQYFNLEWKIPSMNDLGSDRIKINKPMINSQIALNQIVVMNATLKDQGIYECQYVESGKVAARDVLNISIFDVGSSFIKLELEHFYTNPREYMVGETADWIVTIDAYPEGNVTWFSPENHEIFATSKYEIETTRTHTRLEINSLKLSDSGVYVVKVMNLYETQFLNVSLTVEAEPIVEEMPEQYYLAGLPALVECHVTGFPIPKIIWYFQPCMIDADCKEEEILMANTTERFEDWKVTSRISLPAITSGRLRCLARNEHEEESDFTTPFLVSDVANGFGIEEFITPIAIEEDVTLICDAVIYNYTENIKWFDPQMKEIDENSTDPTLIRSRTQYSYRASIHIRSAEKRHSGIYTCRANRQVEDYEDERSISVDVEDWKAPYISYSNLNDSDQFVSLGERDVVLECQILGIPLPNVQWFKDSLPWLPLDSNRFIISNEKTQSRIVFKYIKDEDDGKYSCEAVTKAGTVSRYTHIVIENKYGNQMILFIIIAVIFCIFIIWITYLICRIRTEKAKRLDFEDGNIESINPKISIDEQADLLPYDKKYEFPRDKLDLGKEIGAGAFGVVLKGTARGIVDAEITTTVAVKMVKRGAGPQYVKALASELKIMIHLGKHLNVVNLLGACTMNIAKRELLVIVEYCPYGNIQKYIARHRRVFIDQFTNAGTFNPHQYNRTYSRNSNNTSHQMNEYDTEPVMSMVTGETALCTDDTNRSFIDTQGSEENQPHWRSNYQCDYEYNGQQRRPLCTRDLLCWAFQIARGMEYLAERRVLHGDLAARNILLADDNVVKICDFGLARTMSKNADYKKEGNGPLPAKWMAIESIRDQIFSTQSDVWSFGVVLWELFSLASTPYPGLTMDLKLIYQMLEGYRMSKPKYANETLYCIMRECWSAEPVERPSFTLLQQQLGAVLEDSVRTHYMELNEPYLEMNRSGMNTDYLQMMAAPLYTNLTASRDYVNEPHNLSALPHPSHSPQLPVPSSHTDGEGYLTMSPHTQRLIYITKPEEQQFVFNIQNGGIKYNLDTDSHQNELIPMLGNRNPRTASESGYEGSTSLEDSFTNSIYSQVAPSRVSENICDDSVFENGNIQKITSRENGKLVANREPDWQSDAFSNPSYVSVEVPNLNCKNNNYPNGYINLETLGESLKV